MARLYLVRHGRPAAEWGEDTDPGLDETGKEQADKVARKIGPLGPLPIITSPLLRARETSLPLAQKWGLAPRVEERVGEIPSPSLDLRDRLKWLGKILFNEWPNMEPGLQAWRKGVIETLFEQGKDAVIFTHFIAINVAIGAAIGDSRVMCASPGYTSITIIQTDDARLELIERGEEEETRVL